ncbi:MAG TPA: glycosyltransferase family 9 protein [Rhabdochlamydiaceae bacterium]|nr:glycosyltransferase family 9 protein [Rhabdochlamydiaceae bacterium]
MKIAVFSCAGLGDCLLTTILSQNLASHGHDRGHEVVTFHPFMSQMQSWFPRLPLRPFPPKLEEFDRFFIFYEKSDWMFKVLETCQAKFRDKTTVLNPIATPNTDYPYWEEGRFDGNQTFADNLVAFCKMIGIEKAVKSNGISLPAGLQPRRYLKRVVLHPTSSRPGKNWPRLKFLKLAERLSESGYEPVFIVSPAERIEWPEAPLFSSLDEMARFVGESGFMIGNDSGIGHLASCIGVPTVSLFKNERTANFWRPSFAPGEICLPQGWLPNLKGLRWRDKYWHWGLSVGQVFRTFEKFCVLCDQTSSLSALGKEDIVRRP